jgi:uncharacterized protein YjiS (DUF1127 family)
MSYIEQLFPSRPQPQWRVPYSLERRAASERSPKHDKAQSSLPQREAAQPERRFDQETPIRAQYPTRTQQTSAPRWYVSISAMAMFLLTKIRDELAIRQAMAELRDLDDRMLRDIGLSRCDIASIGRRDT